MKNVLLAGIVSLFALEGSADSNQMDNTYYSQEEVCCEKPRPVEYAGCGKVFSDNYVEFRASYLYLLDEDLREVYPSNVQLGVELNAQLYDMLYAWAEVDYFSTEGHTQGNHEDTRLTMVPISLGPKFIYNRYCFQPYLGVGALATYVHTNVNSSYLINSLSTWSWGGLFKVGCIAKPTDYLVIDFFMDYAYRYAQMDNTKAKPVITPNVNIGALSFGAGLGYRF